MEIKEFIKLFSDISIPFSYAEFSRLTRAPCMVYLDAPNENIYADSESVLNDDLVRLELYCKPTDKTTHKKIEEILKNNKITYDKDKTYVSDRKEDMYIYNCYI